MIMTYNIFEKSETPRIPKIGDLVVCIGNIDNLKTHNHIGILRKEGIEFLNRFSDKLHDLKGTIRNNRGWFVKDPNWMKYFDNNQNGDNAPMIYSKKFKDIISYSLKYLIDYEDIYYSDISYIDVTPRNDTISYLRTVDYDKLEADEDPWKSSMRQNMRISRFLKKISNDPDILENSVNEYKFSYNLNKDDFGRFKVVRGMAMSKWYLGAYYADGGGSLQQSCMRHMKSQKRLSIYTNNPDKIAMLFILNPLGKLLGRALLWRLDDPAGVIYMDRIYYVDDYIEKLFLDYAQKKGYLTKTTSDEKDMLLRVNIGRNFGPPQNNPYMDTFKYFIKDGNYLLNRFRNLKAGDYWEYIDHD